MPKQTTSNIIGRTGERWFQSQLPANWILQLPTEDIGIDGLVVICEEGKLNGTEFRVQIKSSSDFTIRDNKIILSGIKRSSLQYWLTGLSPTLLVLYDGTSRKGWCYWINALAGQSPEIIQSKSDTVSLQVPATREINENCWDQIRNDLSLLNNSISKAFIDARQFQNFIPTLNVIHECARNLIFVNYAIPEGETWNEEGIEILHKIELFSHRDFVNAIERFRRQIPLSTEAENFMVEFLTSYKGICQTYVGDFDGLLINFDPEYKVDYAPSIMEKERFHLLGLMMKMLCTLTQSTEE